MSDLPTGLLVWWLALGTVSLFNIGLLVKFWIAHLNKSSDLSQDAYQLRRRLLWLSILSFWGVPFGPSSRAQMYRESP